MSIAVLLHSKRTPKSYRRASFVNSCLFFACWASLNAQTSEADVPSYSLKPGMEIRYSTKVAAEQNATLKNPKRNWKVWVTRSNNDGSHRLVIRYSSGQDSKGTEDLELACFDFFDDGHFNQIDNRFHNFGVEEIFPRLPADLQELHSGWHSRGLASNIDYQYITKNGKSRRSDIWRFTQIEDGPAAFLKPYAREAEFVFDRTRGLIDRSTINTKPFGGSDKVHGEAIECAELIIRDPAWISTLDGDVEEYLNAEFNYDELLGGLETPIDEANMRLGQASQLWADLEQEVTNAVIKEAAKFQLARHNGSRHVRLAEATAQAKVIGRKAAEWERPDFEETLHKISDYAGTVVLLHFWNSRTRSSFYSMVQANQIADEFAGDPVTVLGMNTDYDLEEAQFVDGAMGLKYPSVRIDEELAAEYGVSSIPTFVLVDQKGVVRWTFVDSAPRVKDDIKAVIRDLLANEKNSGVRK